jgi:hypothetical protein
MRGRRRSAPRRPELRGHHRRGGDRALGLHDGRPSRSSSAHRPLPGKRLAIASAGSVAGCHVRAMRTAMSSAGWGASAASRVSQAWLTGSVLVVVTMSARRAGEGDHAVPAGRIAPGCSRAWRAGS